MKPIVSLFIASVQLFVFSNANAQAVSNQVKNSAAQNVQVQNVQVQPSNANAVSNVNSQVSPTQVAKTQNVPAVASNVKTPVQNQIPTPTNQVNPTQVQAPTPQAVPTQVAPVQPNAQVVAIPALEVAPKPEIQKPAVPSLTKQERALLKDQQYSPAQLRKILAQQRQKNVQSNEAEIKPEAQKAKIETSKAENGDKKEELKEEQKEEKKDEILLSKKAKNQKNKGKKAKLKELQEEKLQQNLEKNEAAQNSEKANQVVVQKNSEEKNDEEIPQNLIAVKNIFKFRGDNKTQGHYLGLDFVRTDSSFDSRFISSTSGGDYYINRFKKSNSLGVGVSYGYAFNADGFFFMPIIFAEQNQFGADSNNGQDRVRLRINNRIGMKLNLGYDFNKFFAPYLTAGYSRIYYSAKGYGESIDRDDYNKVNKGYEDSDFYGMGLKFNLNDKLALNFEYNNQKISAEAGVPDVSTDYISRNYFNTRLGIYKAGLMYNF